jgi:hypothetical protein
MKALKTTAVRIVDRIEPCLPFWCDALGFEKVAEVPHGEVLGFVILVKDGSEIMLQTRASVADDLPAVGARNADTALFIEVDSVADAMRRTKNADVLVKERTTSYGMKETVVADASGTIVIFAEKK